MSDKSEKNSEKIAEKFLKSADDYFRSEMKLVTSDYECLTQMNNSALDRYRVMHRTLQHANENLKSMNEANCNRLQATASVLNEIEDSMSNLESTIMHLDAYSRSLETQLKKYEKRPLTITSTTANSPTAS